MVADLIFDPRVEADIAEAYAWYEGQRIGLGEMFMARVDACVQGIVRNPEGHRVVHERYRRALVRRLPYAVFYEFEGGVVTIYCIIHTARDPEKWRRRLP